MIKMNQAKKTKKWFYDHMPILTWLPAYNVSRDLKFDLIAGITVAMMIIPQAVSLAAIMGVDPVHGLYTAAIVPLIYPIFGTSRVLSVANGAAVSLLVGSTLEPLDTPEERIAMGIFLSFYVGSIMLLMSILKLELVVDFFSRPVMGGYISAQGLLIMASQFRNLTGILTISNSEYVFITIYRLVSNIHHVHFPTFILGTLSILLLVGLRCLKKSLAPMTLEHVFAPRDDNDDVEVSGERTDNMDTNSTSDEYTLGTTPCTAPPASWSFSLTDCEFLRLEQVRKERQQPSALPSISIPISTPPSKKRFCTSLCSFSPQTKMFMRFLLGLFCDLKALVVCLMGITAGYILVSVLDSNVAVIGTVPSGFPTPLVPWYGLGNLLTTSSFGRISLNAVVIALVSYMSSIAIAKRLAVKGGYQVVPNQELIGIGMGNLIGSFFQIMPATGAMSRTAVNAQNAKTQLASLITACIVLLAVQFGTSLLFYLPKATLAAIIIVAAYSLIELEEARWLYSVKRDEFLVWLSSFVLTLIFGVVNGLIASVLSSLVAIMWRTR